MSAEIFHLYKYNIINGNAYLGKAIRHFSYNYMTNKNEATIVGRISKKKVLNQEKFRNQKKVPFGSFNLKHNNNKYVLYTKKYEIVNDELIHTDNFPTEVTLYLVETEKDNNSLHNIDEIKKRNATTYYEIIEKFLHEAVEYYDKNVLDNNTEPDKVGVYIYKDYWKLLNKHDPRKISTIHLDGKETELLEYINKFKTPEVKKRYNELGIPYKKNIMLEGYPGTGKTSLIFSIASELNCNVAFINFHRELDDTGLMQAITEIPDNSILVFEDIDALFKERKENDGYKNSITFSALLNIMDGLAYGDTMISFMTTNFLCNLDSALKRPGRIDKIVHFDVATKSQTEHMFNKFFPDATEDFEDFYDKIELCKYTTAILQQYFMWYMDDYPEVIKNIKQFKDMCRKNNYSEQLDLYS